MVIVQFLTDLVMCAQVITFLNLLYDPQSCCLQLCDDDHD